MGCCSGRIVVKRKQAGSDSFDNDLRVSLGVDKEVVDVADAKSTAADSSAIMDWMRTDGIAWVAARGGRLVGWEGFRDGVSVWVGIENLNDSLKGQLAAEFPGRLVIESVEVSQQEFSRTNQPSPFWGGARSYAQLEGGASPAPCTIGPIVYHTVNTEWIRALTAGHCGYIATSFTHPATSYDHIAYMEYRNYDGYNAVATDSALLRPNSGFNFAGKVWENDYSRNVAGYTTGLNGDRVVMSGGVSQTVSNVYVQGDPAKNNCHTLDGNWVCHAVTYVKPGTLPTQPTWISFSQTGDSGSPVYSQTYPTYIYGMHVGSFRVALDYRGVYVKVMSALKVLGDGKWAVKRG